MKKPKRPAEKSRDEQSRIWPEVMDKTWPEAVILAEPRAHCDAPTVLVGRREGQIFSPTGEALVCLPGYPAISLFTGCGGMDLGMEQAGFVALCQHEMQKDACQTLIANRPRCFRDAALIQGDIRETSTWMLLREAGLRVGECHLVTGGPPCQGFSTSNSRACRHEFDHRNDLVFEFLRVVRETQTRFFCMENVPGFLRFNHGKYLQSYLESAHGCGYELVYGLVNCVEYGVPQDRCRFICMGTRRDLVEIDGMLGSLPEPVCFGEADLARLRLLDGIHTPEAEAARARLRRPPGIRYFPGRPVLIPPDPHGRSEGRSRAFHEFYDRIEREEPDLIVRAPRGGETELEEA